MHSVNSKAICSMTSAAGKASDRPLAETRLVLDVAILDVVADMAR